MSWKHGCCKKRLGKSRCCVSWLEQKIKKSRDCCFVFRTREGINEPGRHCSVVGLGFNHRSPLSPPIRRFRYFRCFRNFRSPRRDATTANEHTWAWRSMSRRKSLTPEKNPHFSQWMSLCFCLFGIGNAVVLVVHVHTKIGHELNNSWSLVFWLWILFSPHVGCWPWR